MSCNHDHAHDDVGHVCGGANGPAGAQSLDEMAFERGLWPAALNGDIARLERLLQTHSVTIRFRLQIVYM